MRRVSVLATQLHPSQVVASSHNDGLSGHSLPTNKSSTVVVTGAAGFVGGWLVKKLLERGHVVRACVRDSSNERKVAFLSTLPAAEGRLTIHSADMTVAGAYDEIFKGALIVFHPAEVFMSFGPGRDAATAQKDFGSGRVTSKSLAEGALRSSQLVCDSINRSTTVRRLVYTSSIASMMPGALESYHENPVVDERREPTGGAAYGTTKRATEHFFAYQASISRGRWSCIICNPADIVGPILSPHQAGETWQGKIAAVLRGEPAPQEWAGRPWVLVDVRDVAEAEIRCAESELIPSGCRHLVASGDWLPPQEIGPRVMELFPHMDLPNNAKPAAFAQGLVRTEPIWSRVHVRTDRIRSAVGLHFRSFDETLRDTVISLLEIGGVSACTI